jgi:molybdopterin molybdotransferase
VTVHQAIASPGCGCDVQDLRHPLISIDDALVRIGLHVAPVPRTEAVGLDRAFGRILAQPVTSRTMAPPFDNAAMDGYALDSSALTGSGP